MAQRKIEEQTDDNVIWLIAIVIGLLSCQGMFRNISGGFANPAIAFAQIVWQNNIIKQDSKNA